ncbi:uncharacterized protein [Chelonus insularis]|uniref:uncharacterized protein n=1 Tax=Chelonus insularis TaxID=460826 RepID=UPI00158D61E0|nr:uncharacterized protein LOC118069083 [Chelonus insularis]
MPQKSNPDKRHSKLNVRRKGKIFKGGRYVLSHDAQVALSNLLSDVIEETLDDAKKMAEDAGKNQVSIEDIERALKKLCYNIRSVSAHNPRVTLNSSNIVF